MIMNAQNDRDMLAVWQALTDLPDAVKKVLPDCRERAMVLTKLDEARMWFENSPKASPYF